MTVELPTNGGKQQRGMWMVWGWRYPEMWRCWGRPSDCVLSVSSKHGNRPSLHNSLIRSLKGPPKFVKLFSLSALSVSLDIYLLFLVNGVNLCTSQIFRVGGRALLSIISSYRHLPNRQKRIQTVTSAACNIVVIGNRSYLEDWKLTAFHSTLKQSCHRRKMMLPVPLSTEYDS